PGAAGVTVAVKKTVALVEPTARMSAAREVVVASGFTVSLTVAEALAVKGAMPAKVAWREWTPTPNGTTSTAWPLGSTATTPRTVVPSKKVTEPTGVPLAEVTVAVSVIGWPVTAGSASVVSVRAVATGSALLGAGEVFKRTATLPGRVP